MKENLITWILKKREIEEDIEDIHNTLKDKMILINKLKREKEEIKKQLDFIEDRDFEKTKIIKELRKKIRLLNKREKKLQTIEMLYANQPVDLKELNNLIMGVKGDK